MANKAMSTGALVIAIVWCICSAAAAQGMPAEYQGVLDVLARTGDFKDGVLKVNIPRNDIKVQEMGAAINARMGLNTWAAFFGSDAAAVVAGDVAMIDTEVTPVLKALRDNGIEVVAIHHHMTATQPTVIFLHYWGQGPAEKLALAVRAAVNQTGPRPAK
jgi:Domain of Unknown Function (DUF1259)